MDQKIVQRIKELGGEVTNSQAATTLEFIQSIKFPGPIYPKDEDGDLYHYGVYKFYTDNKALYENDREIFFKNLVTYHFSDDDSPRRQAFWRGSLFTPFTEGSPDYKEWRFDRDESSALVDVSPVRAVVGDGELQFVQLTYVYGYPDHFYICLQDPIPENPTVFGTDHETFFDDICTFGRLADFFQNHYTAKEFLDASIDYLNDQAD